MTKRPMRIGEVARQAGISAKTLRFYEAVGLLPSPPRSEGGYRLYSEGDLRLLRFVRTARALGLSIGEIRSILAHSCPCDELRDLMEARRRTLEAQIRALEEQRARLERLLATWDDLPDAPAEGYFCPRLERAAL